MHVVNTLDLSGAPEGVAALEAIARLESLPPERDKVLLAIERADGYLASAVVRIDEEFLRHAPRLRVIGSPSTGTDHMDLAAIRRAGITVFDIAKEFGLLRGFTATSEHAFALLLMVSRRLVPAVAAAKAGDWARERFRGFQLYQKTFGVIGLGRLGEIAARIAQGFGMRVVATDVREVSMVGVQMVDFATLLRESDVVSLHVHLTPETRQLLGRAEFARMQRHAIVINTSRGAVIDETALLEALKSGTIAGAGLDVIDGEWLTPDQTKHHPLIAYAREHDNLVITPHVASATTESMYGARTFMAKKVAEHLRQLTLKA